MKGGGGGVVMKARHNCRSDGYFLKCTAIGKKSAMDGRDSRKGKKPSANGWAERNAKLTQRAERLRKGRTCLYNEK